MEGARCSLEIGALSPIMVTTEKPKLPMPMAAPFWAPLEEAEPQVVNTGEDSTQEQNTTNPENLQHDGVQEDNFQQRFRRFRYKDATGPRQLLQHLRELSQRWLDPAVRTKEQIIELLVQEQFRAILPEELRPLIQEKKTDV
ncbi:zinc finger and SCAN domain-containing protein 30-like [Phascolarctos cinereus]|uniref:SCAN domain-containing protein 1 n=1 Tax=Phascolarctos cinereus TaxID=38626 RepID=A0A6P5JPF5_PHACI|nr:SCAN domain-containing protein 1-like [Phascolarctos cinereus]XP_020838660.1 SCAN domain-containing protein 1-like [Phascolarctos cinereus]